ncbi:MAG TPA: DUF1289 domain-containing protein [Casimicrobiaceae bacterium]|jgi:hypothetical protein|nr:DUF1289 domain-containing protein [Casimicrobiaceae bacterium]
MKSGGAEVASPCTSVCTIDAETGLCVGCYRTLDEIAGWIDLSAEQKRTLLATLLVRRARFHEAVSARHPAGNERDAER